MDQHANKPHTHSVISHTLYCSRGVDAMTTTAGVQGQVLNPSPNKPPPGEGNAVNDTLTVKVFSFVLLL